MSGKFLLDTNAIINILKSDKLIKKFKRSKLCFFFSLITEIELLSYSSITRDEEKNIREFLRKSCVISIDDDIKEETIKLRKKYNLKIPDAIICGTPSIKDLKLITDDKTFFRVSDIKVGYLKDVFL